tara:strand:- start:122 stop:331 length:210 start_codon:yes stop_codon:yes gene_type:complete
MISSELRLLSASFAETASVMVDDGCFSNAACDLIPLQMTLIHFLQREIITNHLLLVEPDWPWAKQPTRQ